MPHNAPMSKGRSGDKEPTIEQQAGRLFGRMRSEYTDGLASLHEAMALGFKRTDEEFGVVRRQMAQFQNRVADRFSDVEKKIDAVAVSVAAVTAAVTDLTTEVRAIGRR